MMMHTGGNLYGRWLSASLIMDTVLVASPGLDFTITMCIGNSCLAVPLTHTPPAVAGFLFSPDLQSDVSAFLCPSYANKERSGPAQAYAKSQPNLWYNGDHMEAGWSSAIDTAA